MGIHACHVGESGQHAAMPGDGLGVMVAFWHRSGWSHVVMRCGLTCVHGLHRLSLIILRHMWYRAVASP